MGTWNVAKRAEPIEWAGHSVTLVSQDTGVHLATKRFEVGGWYRRPVSVEAIDSAAGANDRIRIPDFVMIARIAGALTVALATLMRSVRR